MIETIEQTLIRHEGLRLKPYRCTAGKLTIGVGRNLDDVGITREEAIGLLHNDIMRVAGELAIAVPWFTALDNARYGVLVNMGFNLGVPGLLKFKRFFAALQAKDYDEAAQQMLDSKWARQVGNRAEELAEIIRHG